MPCHAMPCHALSKRDEARRGDFKDKGVDADGDGDAGFFWI